MRVYSNHDLIGCKLGGVLKNIIAIAAGMGDGLGKGRSIDEITNEMFMVAEGVKSAPTAESEPG